jgi:hypothetical protein
LPDDGQGFLLVSVADICAANTDNLATNFRTTFDCIIAIDAFLKDIVGIHVDFGPVYDIGVDSVNHFAQQDSISAIVVQVLNEDILKTKRVDPKSELSFLTRTCTIGIETCWIIVVGFDKTVVGVENLSSEDDIDLLISLSESFGRNNITASKIE